MSNETKQDVFEGLLESYMYSADMVIDEISTDGVADRLNLGNIIASTRYRYDAALPDDLPVIPKEVSDRLKQAKADKSSLRYMFACSSINMLSDWWMAKNTKNEDVFARAWLLGAWRVEETGEIVKLEVEE